MKTSDKIMTTLIIIAILAAGGYFLYKHFVLDKETYGIEDVEGIEAEVVWEGDEYEYEYCVYSLIEICDALNASNANYFTMNDEYFAEWGYTTITQTDSETFNNTIEAAESHELIKHAANDMDYFLNTNYSKIGEAFWGVSSDIDGPTLFGPKNICGIEKEEIIESFGLDIKQYFLENEVVLNCDNVQIKKICAGNVLEDNGYIRGVRFYYMGTAEVTTESAKNDLSDLGVFGNAGETVSVEFMGIWSGNKHGSDIGGSTRYFVLNRIY